MDAQRPHVQLAGLGRLSQVEPCVPEVVGGRGDLAVVGAVLALLDRQRPLVQLAGLGRLPQLAPGDPEVVEGPGPQGVVPAVLALHDRQRPLVPLAGLARLPQLEPRAPEVLEGPGDLAVVLAIRRLGQLEQTLPRWHLCSRLPASVAELGSPAQARSRQARQAWRSSPTLERRCRRHPPSAPESRFFRRLRSPRRPRPPREKRPTLPEMAVAKQSRSRRSRGAPRLPHRSTPAHCDAGALLPAKSARWPTPPLWRGGEDRAAPTGSCKGPPVLIALAVSGCMSSPAGPVGGVEFGSEGRARDGCEASYV